MITTIQQQYTTNYFKKKKEKKTNKSRRDFMERLRHYKYICKYRHKYIDTAKR